VRTTSWSLDAIADRRALKGQRRSDPVVQTLSVPWHLVVSAPGTVVLLLAACGSAAVLALVLGAFGLPESRALFAGGVLGALALWWGPGSRRLRRPVRRAVWHVSRSDTSGAAWTGLVLGGVVVMLVALGSVGVQWFPDDSPPIDPGVLVPPGFQ
jgi:hypothetical protein